MAAMKLAGDLPGLPWSEVVGALGTHERRMRDSSSGDELFLVNADELFSGDVRVDRVELGDGPCPVRWETPLGPVWGHRGDVGLPDRWFRAKNQVLARLSANVLDIGAREGLFALDSLARGAKKVWIQPRDPASAGCIRRMLADEIGARQVTLVDGLTGVEDVELLRVSPDVALGVWSQIASNRLLRGARLFIADGFIPIQSIYATAIEPESPCPVLWQTRVGALWGRPKDVEVLAMLDAELTELEMYINEIVAVEPGDVVLDIGGHLGMLSLQSLSKGAARIVVFEPNPGNLACLEKTFAEEIESGQVTVIDAAAWESIGTLQFDGSPDAQGYESASGAVSGSGELTVRAATIDHVVDQLGLERVDYIKMDIEGSERHALAGARRTIERSAPKLALCIYHREDDPEVILRVVAAIRPSYEFERGMGSRSGQVYFYERSP